MRAMTLSALVSSLALALAPAALAQHGAAPAPAASSGGRTVDLQGGNPRAFVDNPVMRQFYQLSVDTLRPGAPPVDMKAYETKAFGIFNAFGEQMRPGGGPAMVDHLKLIPGQVAKIAKDDPHVLDNFDNFADALVGPK